MAKMKQMAANDAKSNTDSFYGTKPEWVKAELDLRMCDVFENASKEKVVVAEDEKGLYITGKSYVGASLMDPNRMYHRVVPEVITEGENIIYKVNM